MAFEHQFLENRVEVSERFRLRLYEAYIIPVLTYNSGTWGLSKTEMARMDSFHRRQLRSIIDISQLYIRLPGENRRRGPSVIHNAVTSRPASRKPALGTTVRNSDCDFGTIFLSLLKLN